MRATQAAERSGVAAFAVVTSEFLTQARTTAKALGAPELDILEYPGVIPHDTEDELESKARGALMDQLVAALTSKRLSLTAGGYGEEVIADEIVASGSFEDVCDFFYSQGWTDGLPIVPPTLDRVSEFLRWTGRPADEVISVLPLESREATVWNVAVNGVMAGCRPEYMPILIAVVEAVSDPEWGLEHAGSTPGWEPLVVGSGPVFRELGFDCGSGLMRVGTRPNSSVGRFLKLFMRNVCGLRQNSTDKASIGTSFNVVMVEDEAAIQRIGWSPYRVDKGFDLEDSVVTVQSVYAISPPIYCAGSETRELLEPLTHFTGTTLGWWAFCGIWMGRQHQLVLMGPSVAQALAERGVGKADVRRHLYDSLRVSARDLECYRDHVTGQRDSSLASLVATGEADSVYAASDDPDRLVPMIMRDTWTDIVVAGDPGRNQARVYVNNHVQGPPIARRVEVSSSSC